MYRLLKKYKRCLIEWPILEIAERLTRISRVSGRQGRAVRRSERSVERAFIFILSICWISRIFTHLVFRTGLTHHY